MEFTRAHRPARAGFHVKKVFERRNPFFYLPALASVRSTSLPIESGLLRAQCNAKTNNQRKLARGAALSAPGLGNGCSSGRRSGRGRGRWRGRRGVRGRGRCRRGRGDQRGDVRDPLWVVLVSFVAPVKAVLRGRRRRRGRCHLGARARVRALALRAELNELFLAEQLAGDLDVIEGRVPLNQIKNR